jgi:hypothetical protein
MPSSGMLRRVAVVSTDVSKERISSIIRVTRISELGMLEVTSNQSIVTANVVPSSLILVTLMMEEIRSSEMSVLTTAMQHNIPEDSILHRHHRENLKPYSENMILRTVLCFRS